MSRPSFFNDNLNRHYPLVENTTAPVYGIVDFGCTFFPGADFDPAADTVSLEQIRKIGDEIEFEFSCSAVAGALIFRFDVTDTEFTTRLATISASHVDETSSYTIVELEEDCAVEPIWSGFMTCGDLAKLADDLTSPIDGPVTVEPSRIQSQKHAYVRSVTLYNADRTRSDVATGCKSLCWPFTPSDYYLVGECLTGHLAFKEGYNSDIRQDTATNAIALSAYVGAGEGAVCSQPVVFSGEEPPDYRTSLDGALKCSEVVRSVNGVGGKQFSITGMEGVSITPVPNKHKIIVNVDMLDMQLCTDFRTEGEAPETSSYELGECDCGPEV